MESSNEKSTIIFDGECNLCNGVVGWLLKFAPKRLFEFVPFQSPRGQHILKENNLPTQQLDTVILLDQEGLHTHSDGFLKIVAAIPKWQRVAALLGFIPRLLRDFVYRTASRNRLKWFGTSTSCTIDLQ